MDCVVVALTQRCPWRLQIFFVDIAKMQHSKNQRISSISTNSSSSRQSKPWNLKRFSENHRVSGNFFYSSSWRSSGKFSAPIEIYALTNGSSMSMTMYTWGGGKRNIVWFLSCRFSPCVAVIKSKLIFYNSREKEWLLSSSKTTRLLSC